MAHGFSITYKNVDLDIEDGSQLTVEWYSTVFNESELFRGSYSYPVNLKWSEKNLLALNFANLIENRLARIDLQVSISLFGQTWKNATLSLDIEHQKLPAVLLVDNAIISQKISEQTLSDIFIKVDGLNRDPESMHIGNDLEDSKRQMKLSAQTPYSLPYAFPQYTNFAIWGNRDLSESAIVNRFLSQYVPDGSGDQYDVSGDRLFNPMFYLVWVIKEICKRVGFEAEGSFLNDPEVMTWLIYNTGYYTASEISAGNFVIYPARHLPKISISSFFKLLRNDLGLFIYFDSLSKKARFEMPGEILSNPSVLDFSSWIIDKTTKVKGVKDKAFLFNLGVDDGDDTYNFLPFTRSKRLGLPGDHKPVDITISAPIMNSGKFSGFMPLPFRQIQVSQVANVYSDQYVNSSAFNKKGEISKNGFTLRFVSFRGIRSTGQFVFDRLIPYATSDNRDANGLLREGWVSTNLDAANNWLETIASKFYRMMTLTESVEFDARIPIDRWMHVNPMQISSMSLYNGIKTPFLPDRITFEPAYRSSNIFAKVKGYLYHKVYGLINPADMQAVPFETVEPAEHVYIAWRFIDEKRTEFPNGSYEIHAKPQLLFFSDPFATIPKTVSKFKFRFKRILHVPTGESAADYDVETAENVTLYTDEEWLITGYVSGGYSYTTIEIVPDDLNTYSGI
ncbi:MULTISPECIES: hypothetical protein [Sphingobacterium]|uniref:Uncharacterized protein n=1 Tax=Sphingobacterium populi TaxID=1812824 RepID=A0ABW5U822_9SPHI|nr:hypothetical protein [Sphingobacterium sp. CFCC 11742]